MAEQPHNLQQLLDRFGSASTEHDAVALSSIVEEIGTRSYGPLLLFAGVVMASPISGIPGLPTAMGVFVILISGQLLLHKTRFWLPRWILNRSISRNKLDKAIRGLRRPARAIDRLFRARLTWLVGGRSEYVVATICAVIALGVPFMEVVPFSATLAGAAITMFGLSLITRDGLLAVFGFAASGGVLALVLLYVF